MTCGLVVVSHSAKLGEALRELALTMVPVQLPKIYLACGDNEGGLGTDGVLIAQVITQAATENEQVVVFLDLGSSIMNTQTALELVDPEVASRTVLTKAPLVEGLIGAVVQASLGKTATEVVQEAQRGLLPKEMLLD